MENQENQEYIINFQKLHEPPRVERIIARIQEDKNSWISGLQASEENKLILAPVDMNMENMLATNMISCTKDEYKVLRKDMFVGYTVEFSPQISLEFFSPLLMREKNIELISGIQKVMETNAEVATVFNSGVSNSDKIWDALSASHLKGLRTIYFLEGAIEYNSGSHLQRMFELVDIRQAQPGISKVSGLTLVNK